jgi:hypothetical protein
MVWAAAIAPEPIASFRSAEGSENRMVPEVRACSGYLVITAPTGVSRQRRSPGSRPHTALGALRYVDDGTRLADELQRLPPRPGGAGVRGRLRRLQRARGRRARAPGRPDLSAPRCPTRPVTAAVADSRHGPGRPRPSGGPASPASRFRLRRDPADHRPQRRPGPRRQAHREGRAGPTRPTGKCQLADGVLRRYTTRCRWFGYGRSNS